MTPNSVGGAEAESVIADDAQSVEVTAAIPCSWRINMKADRSGIVLLMLAIAGVPCNPALSQQTENALSVRLATVEARVQQLEDEREIHAIVFDYMRFSAARDWQAYADLFTADGELELFDSTHQGRQAIFDRVAGSTTNTPRPDALPRVSFLTGVNIQLHGDQATSVSRFNSYAENADGTMSVTGTGRYEDVLVKIDGRWKIRKRSVNWDMPRRMVRPAR